MALGAIASALAALKAAKDVAETMIGLRDTATFQGKMLEFQSKIIDANNAALSAQEERSTLLAHIQELEKEIIDLKAWEVEKGRYELRAFEGRVFAYSLRIGEQGSEPMHLICAHCFQSGRKSILQGTVEVRMRRRIHVCPSCKMEFPLIGDAILNSSVPSTEPI